ncbi:PRD domain-containing protein [Pediococcus acidilactici]
MATAVDRLKKGIVIDNPYTDEIKMNLPIAFDVAIQLGEAIETQYPVQLRSGSIEATQKQVIEWLVKQNLLQTSGKTGEVK